MHLSGSDRARANGVRDLAVRAVMALGEFEVSGDARLAVFRRAGLMIAYHTPFNPLPPQTYEARCLAESEGRRAHLQPYGITVWIKGIGKVFSAGWQNGKEPVVDFYWPGHWEKRISAALAGTESTLKRQAAQAQVQLIRNAKRSA